MEYRPATSEDLPALAQLSWDVFGDDEHFVELSFDMLAGPQHVYVAQQDGQVVAQLYAIPCHVGEAPGIYLFALATRTQSRGGGVMSGLMRYAEAAEMAKGALFSVLIPADDPLYGYYEKRGYTQKIRLRCLEKQLQGLPASSGRYTSFLPKEFGALRSQYIHCPYVDFTPGRYAEILQDLSESGFAYIQSGAGYAVYCEEKGHLLVAELFCEDDAAADALLAALGQKTGCASARLTLAEAAGPYPGQGALRPAALAKALDEKYVENKLYLRFGFDEIKE